MTGLGLFADRWRVANTDPVEPQLPEGSDVVVAWSSAPEPLSTETVTRARCRQVAPRSVLRRRRDPEELVEHPLICGPLGNSIRRRRRPGSGSRRTGRPDRDGELGRLSGPSSGSRGEAEHVEAEKIVVDRKLADHAGDECPSVMGLLRPFFETAVASTLRNSWSRRMRARSLRASCGQLGGRLVVTLGP